MKNLLHTVVFKTFMFTIVALLISSATFAQGDLALSTSSGNKNFFSHLWVALIVLQIVSVAIVAYLKTRKRNEA